MEKHNSDFIRRRLMCLKIMKLALKKERNLGEESKLRYYINNLKDNKTIAKA